jgi:release factor glutamine methyltransferase
MSDLAGAIAAAAARLAEAGIADARHEARLLVVEATGIAPTTLIAEPRRSVADEDAGRLATLVARRAAREPLSRVIGWREFWSLRFALTADTLDPRPDSETLVAAALEAVRNVGEEDCALAVLDLGTGSGCLLLALLSELPLASGLGIDISEGALAAAKANARSLGLVSRARFARGDWGLGLAERFDLILCNPPYIPAGEIADLEPEVARFEPPLALAGGPDGLAAYRRLAVELPILLAPGGRAFLEVGAGQADAVEAILTDGGLRLLGRRHDLANRPRCLIFGPPIIPQKTIGKGRAND